MTTLQNLKNQIDNQYRVVRENEIRIAKELQEYWPNWTWSKCLKEASLIIARHGCNVTIVKE